MDRAKDLKVLLSVHEFVPLGTRFTVHVALDVQLAPQTFRATEEHTSLTRRMDLADSSKDHVPVRPAEVRGCS